MTYIMNNVSSKSVPLMPYELWTGRQPDLSNLRSWGSSIYIYDSTNKYEKLGSPGRNVFLSDTLSILRVTLCSLVKQDDRSITEIESRNGKFLETDFPKRGEIKGNEPLFELSDSDNRLLPNESSKAQVDELLFDSSGRDPDHNDSSDPSRSNPNGNNPHHDDSYDLSRSNPEYINSSDPQLRKSNRKDEALSCPSRDKWINAMEEEMNSMKSNNVWELVEIPHGRKAIGNK
ncbi:uncharacterized protein LOC121996771 [Zingiber officinale]|uniref:uncharacterized protein LOC121996771 n=1 Tax=Zingiber officinale TaxID=94328 RepID=UPI001C4D34E7|nr:uncharacterized protein LOC121996771 [Zingiber officinale]